MTNGHDCVPIKLYSQEQEARQSRIGLWVIVCRHLPCVMTLLAESRHQLFPGWHWHTSTQMSQLAYLTTYSWPSGSCYQNYLASLHVFIVALSWKRSDFPCLFSWSPPWYLLTHSWYFGSRVCAGDGTEEQKTRKEEKQGSHREKRGEFIFSL